MSEDRNPLKDTQEMLGDFLREAAVLILIFFPLEVALKDEQIEWPWFAYLTIGAFFTSGLALWLGIRMERRRFDDTSSVRVSMRVRVSNLRDWFAHRFKKDNEE